MRSRLAFPVLIAALLVSAISPCETSRLSLDPKKIYITSFFDCPVYWNNRKIALLRNGTRALLIRSTKGWILVTYWSNGRYITGWIRR